MKSLPCFIGLRVEREQRQRLERLAEETGIGSLSGVLRTLIDGAEPHRLVAPRSQIESEERNEKLAA